MEFPKTAEMLFINNLKDLGYTSVDKDKLIKDFGMTEKEASMTCEKLKAGETYDDIGSDY